MSVGAKIWAQLQAGTTNVAEIMINVAEIIKTPLAHCGRATVRPKHRSMPHCVVTGLQRLSVVQLAYFGCPSGWAIQLSLTEIYKISAARMRV